MGCKFCGKTKEDCTGSGYDDGIEAHDYQEAELRRVLELLPEAPWPSPPDYRITTANLREVRGITEVAQGRLAMIEAENAELRLKLADRDQALSKIAFQRSESVTITPRTGRVERCLFVDCRQRPWRACGLEEGHDGPHEITIQ